ncbi:FIMAH domain-containing protein [Virgibacillus kekensis]|uniref:FIMAH domain-containing protein n=1 Tax=Virgibacillus kekensis TaxID=202261 RepID=A0ABV9DI40_9BACI
MYKTCLCAFSIVLSMLLVFSLFPPSLFNSASAAETNEAWKQLQVENGDFEAATNSESDLPSWDYWSGGHKEGMSITNDFAFEGDQSLRVDNSGVVGLFSQAIKVEAGNTYRMSAQIYVEELLEGNPGIWLRWLNDEGEIIQNNAKYFEDLSLEEWQNVTAEAVAPPKATEVKIFIYQTSNTKTKGYYDDIQLLEKSSVDALDLGNPSFEENSGDGTIPDWDMYPASPRDGTSISLSEEQVYDGHQSVKITDETSGASVGLYSQAVEIDSNRVYTLSGKAYINSGSISLYMKYYDGAGKEVGSYRAGYEKPANEWIDITTEAKAPADAVSAKIFLYAGVAGTSSVYYDDFKLTVKKQLNLPFEYGDPINMGPAALAAKTQGAAIGDKEVYYATNGSPATFYAADAKTGEKIFSQALPGSDVVWGMTVGSDGNVYFSGTYDGILYRYLVDEQRIEQIGKNPSDDWVWELESAEDGKIYGATYPNAKVFQYDIETDEFTDLGTFHEGQKYARGLGVTEKNVYVGIGTTAYLYQMNRETGEKKEVELPITGTQTSVSNIWEYGGKLFVAYGTSLLTIDASTGELLNEMNWEDEHTYDGLISSPSPYDESIVYFRDKRTSELWTYDLDTDEAKPVEPRIKLPASSSKAMEWTTNEDGTKVLSILHHQIEYSVYNPQTNKVEISYPEVEKQGLNIQSLEIGQDDNVYMGGYQGSMGVFDTSKEEYIVRERDPHQIEGIGFLNGDVYMGTYGGARIYKYDTDLPYQYSDGGEGDNPEMVYDIGDEQSRPFTFASGDNKLFVGTISDYGKLGGSLTIYDSKTDEWNSMRNIIQNQSIIGLAYQEGIVYGGSTITGGLGIDPTATEAKMFAYDTNNKESKVFELNVDGLETPEMIGELSIGPDKNLWGTAWGYDKEGIANTVIFAMDPATKEIIKSTELYSGVHRGSSWRPFFMRWDDQGLLYTTAGRKLTVIDPETMMTKQIIGDTVNLMDLDSEGNIYYANGENLYKMPVPLEDASITTEDQTLLQGETTNLDLSVTLANGNTVNLDGADVEWINSSPQVATVDDGKITAINAGSTEIETKVSYNGEEITSNKITINVIVSPSSLAAQVKELETTQQIEHSLSQQLVNRLEQAKHHYKKGNTDQAIKHLNDYLKHLENSDTEEDLKTILENNAESIKDSFLKD